MPVKTVSWENNTLSIIDQTLLPTEYRIIELTTVQEVWDAIKILKVRGAPAIGVCAALGTLVALVERKPDTFEQSLETVEAAASFLATSRPTAVNLFWALDRMQQAANDYSGDRTPEAFFDYIEAQALAIYEEDRELCRTIGRNGAPLITSGSGVLTHCNAGGLATADYGTALAVMFAAHEQGTRFHVFADETRPLLQGARLTAWELQQAGIDVTLICDNMAAQVMREGRVNLVIVGADRIAANGDTANKIGTYGVALLARAHGIPFYVAAPYSTFDHSLASGEGIPIEQRDPGEIIHGFGRQTAPTDIKVYNPAFDVTPAELIAGFITEKGVLRPPFNQSITVLK